MAATLLHDLSANVKKIMVLTYIVGLELDTGGRQTTTLTSIFEQNDHGK